MLMIRSKRYRMFRVAVVVVAALVAGMVGTRLAAADEPLRYVALGDSSAAGPGIPNQINAACGRSDRNWPHVLATILRAELTDVTCSGARIPDLSGRQYGSIAPQFDALGPDTDLVTLAIGGNDIAGSEAFVACATLTPEPTGPTCQERFTVGGVDQYATRVAETAPVLAAALKEIKRRSPQAAVAVVGYLTYWQPGGCFPADPYVPVDADYLQATFDRLMAMLADQAAAHGATYVDIRTPSADHGLCAPPAKRWLEGAIPAVPALKYHPNATGMANAAKIIAAAVPQR
ncbi:SGNH/GDSL hydrolase family protein [Actinomycetes bacterium KLBMP 9797]